MTLYSGAIESRQGVDSICDASWLVRGNGHMITKLS